MKQSFLEQLYHGDYNKDDAYARNKEYHKAINKMVDVSNKLIENLDEAQTETLNEILDVSIDIEAEVANMMFKEGFRIGLVLAAECFMT